MVISQPPGIILHIIIVLHNAASIALNASQGYLVFYTCNYNIRVTHRNGVLSMFYESDPRRDHQQIVLYSFVAPCACSSSSG